MYDMKTREFAHAEMSSHLAHESVSAHQPATSNARQREQQRRVALPPFVQLLH
jgi:hypothetical protein